MSGVRLLTAPGPGGVAVIEVRGDDAVARLSGLTGGRSVGAGEVRLVRLALPDAGPAGAAGLALDLDEALLVGVGRAHVELHLHGSPPLVDEVLEWLAPVLPALGRTPADPTLTLEDPLAALERSAEARLADVPSELGARALVDQARGALRAFCTELTLLDPPARHRRLAALVARSEALRPLFEPVRVVLTGPVNAGKSTLFNLLAGEERAVVSPEPGTTRDALGATVPLGPYALRIIDTAGERRIEGAAAADVERAGQALALALARGADAVLRLARAPFLPVGESPAGAPPVVALTTCAELAFGPDPARWPTQALSAAVAPAAAVRRVEVALLAALGLPEDPAWQRGEPLLFTAAQRALGRAACAHPAGAPSALVELDPLDDAAWARLVVALGAADSGALGAT